MSCRYKCAVTRNGTRCYCGDGYETSSDGRSCTGKQEKCRDTKSRVSRCFPDGCWGSELVLGSLSCSPAVTTGQIPGLGRYWDAAASSARLEQLGAFPGAQSSSQPISAIRCPDLAARRPWRTRGVLPRAHKVTPRREFDKCTLQIVQLSWECYLGIINCRLKLVFFSIFEIDDFLILHPSICFLFYFFLFL